MSAWVSFNILTFLLLCLTTVLCRLLSYSFLVALYASLKISNESFFSLMGTRVIPIWYKKVDQHHLPSSLRFCDLARWLAFLSGLIILNLVVLQFLPFLLNTPENFFYSESEMFVEWNSEHLVGFIPHFISLLISISEDLRFYSFGSCFEVSFLPFF